MYVSLYSMYDFFLCNVLCAIVVCVSSSTLPVLNWYNLKH